MPEGVKVELESNNSRIKVKVSGPKGELAEVLPAGITAKIEDQSLVFAKSSDTPARILGLGYALVRNTLEGVSEGFSRTLEMVGVGYRASKTGPGLKLSLGFSHPVEFRVPEGVEVEVEDDTKVTLRGIDKNLVTQTAADIRKLRPPEPYKGKGIRYSGEVVRRKLGKAAKAAATAGGA
ncbi:MAG: 50S ribosomal protein L6 [bacterium]|nr:50S ribosomal protein L6 [bacterium]